MTYGLGSFTEIFKIHISLLRPFIPEKGHHNADIFKYIVLTVIFVLHFTELFSVVQLAGRHHCLSKWFDAKQTSHW